VIWKGDSPKGNEVQMFCRDGTSDENICRLVSTKDEYQLGGRDFSGVAIDIGAHIGSVTVPLLIDNPGLIVVAIEPVPENLEILRRNIRLNGLRERTTVLPVAAGIDGVVPISHGWKGRHRHVGNLGDGEPEHTEQVISMSFDTIRQGIGVETIALLKIDCEGCEWDVLTDPTLWRAEVIVGEFHGNLHGGWRVSDLLADSHRVETNDWTFVAVPK
jgi:FkbM family methyltransferase